MKQQKAIAITIFLICLLNFPILSLFNKAIFVLGIPLVYIYIFSVWIIGIIIIALIAESKNEVNTPENE
jgi:hypothetical protein